MDIAQLDTFLAIARLGSFSKAAAKLHRSQPAISRRLALLEEELGAPLFERIGRRVQLTDCGRALLSHAEATLASATGGIAAVRHQLGDGEGTVSIGIVGTLVNKDLAAMLARFSALRTPSRLRIMTTSSEAISELVRAGEIVFGLRYFLDADPEIQCQQIGWERMIVVSAPEHRIRTPIHKKAQPNSTTRWIGFSTSKLLREGFGHLLLKQLAKAGVSEPSIMFVDSLSAQKRLVEAGLGFGFLPHSSVRDELAQGSLVIVNLPRLATRIPVALVHRRSGYLSPAAIELRAQVISSWDGRVLPS